MTLARREESGFTLIEMVIAMLVMGIAVVGITAALAALIELTSAHRGHAVAETGLRSFAQAVEAQGLATFKLTGSPDGTHITVSTSDALLVPQTLTDSSGDHRYYVQVDREVMRVMAVSGNSLTVEKNINGATTSHALGTDVVPFTKCGGKELYTPQPSTYQTVAEGLAGAFTGTVNSVQFSRTAANPSPDPVNPVTTVALIAQSDCDDDWDARCPVLADTEPECGYGLARVDVTVTTSDSRLRNPLMSTSVQIRRPSR